jgi:hypothetical protein
MLTLVVPALCLTVLLSFFVLTCSQHLVSTAPLERVVRSEPKQEWAEEERAVAAQYAINLFHPRNNSQEDKNMRTAEQNTTRVHRMNHGSPTVESPKPVVKVRSATKLKADPYVKKTPQIAQARWQVHFFHLESIYS